MSRAPLPITRPIIAQIGVFDGIREIQERLELARLMKIVPYAFMVKVSQEAAFDPPDVVFL